MAVILHSFHKYLLSTYYMEDAVLDSKDKTEKNKHGSCTCGANLVGNKPRN